MAAVWRIEQFLGPEDGWVEDDRRILFGAAQRHLGHHHTFVHEKGEADYFTTAHATENVVEVALDAAGYHRNLLSTRKYRTHHDGGRQYAIGSFAIPLPPKDGFKRQHHIYLFNAPDGGVDMYGHAETSVVEGTEHLTDTRQEHGDPHRIARNALDAASIAHGERRNP